MSYNGGLFENTLYEYGDVPQHPDVRDEFIIGSPGGASTTHHHWTGGFYGTGASMTDKFGYQGERYPHGEYGNIYDEGHSGASNMGVYPPVPEPTQTTKIDDKFELINEPMPDSTIATQKSTKLKPLIILLLFAILYVTFDLWSVAIQKFIFQYVHVNKRVGWDDMTKYAILLSAVFLSIAWYMDIPVTIFE